MSIFPKKIIVKVEKWHDYCYNRVEINNNAMKKEINLSNDILPTMISGIQVSCIDWCIEPSDVDIDFDDEDIDNEKVEKAIEEIQDCLPKEKFFPIKTNVIQEIKNKIDSLADELSNEYGFLVNSFNYNILE